MDLDLGTLVEFKPLNIDNKDIMESNREISNRTRKFSGTLSSLSSLEASVINNMPYSVDISNNEVEYDTETGILLQKVMETDTSLYFSGIDSANFSGKNK